MKKASMDEARKLLDTAVDLEQVIVLETESLRRHLSVDPEADKSLQKIEDRVLEQAELVRNVESGLHNPSPPKREAEPEPSILLAGPALPLDPSRMRPMRSSRAGRKRASST
jgi:hypothetical protein